MQRHSCRKIIQQKTENVLKCSKKSMVTCLASAAAQYKHFPSPPCYLVLKAVVVWLESITQMTIVGKSLCRGKKWRWLECYHGRSGRCFRQKNIFQVVANLFACASEWEGNTSQLLIKPALYTLFLHSFFFFPKLLRVFHMCSEGGESHSAHHCTCCLYYQ